MKYNRRNIWAFAWEMHRGQYDIRPIACSDKKILIEDMEAALEMPWSEIRKKGGKCIKVVMAPNATAHVRDRSEAEGT